MKNRIDHAGIVHSVKMGVLVHNDHHLLRHGVKVSKYILEGVKGKRYRQNLDANQFPYKAVDIFLHGPFQALEVYSLIGALFESLQSLADMFLPQERKFFLSTYKHLLHLFVILKLNSVKCCSGTLYH